MAISVAVREQLSRLLEWNEAHMSFDAAVRDFPDSLRGVQPEGLPYSPWQLLEHLRITQHDILEFCINPDYVEPRWPDDYWPEEPAPVSRSAWDTSIEQFVRDRAALQRLSLDRRIDLESKIPHGQGQTYLRELLLAADHAAYHLGELIVVRRLLGAWPPSSGK
ncbi:MAG TPA: DinB family protein [Gemmatimonadales bacterium]|nr:DinB family protein [Gemmatimonadales bacterium]